MKLRVRQQFNKNIAIVMIGLVVLIFILSVAIIIQSIDISKYANHEKIVVTPMTYNAPFSVSYSAASPSFLEMMAESFLSLRLDVTPETIGANQKFLLSFVSPEIEQKFKSVLSTEAQEIIQNRVSSSFYVQSIKVLPQSSTVDVTGQLITWINNKKFTEQQHYQITMSYQNGVTKILKFIEVKNAKKNS